MITPKFRLDDIENNLKMENDVLYLLHKYGFRIEMASELNIRLWFEEISSEINRRQGKFSLEVKLQISLF